MNTQKPHLKNELFLVKSNSDDVKVNKQETEL